MKYKTAYRWCFWFKKQLRLSFLPYTLLMTELAYFYYTVTILLSSTSLKIYGWSLLNGILKKNEISWLFFSPLITSPIYRFIFCTSAHPPSNPAMKQNLCVLPSLQHPDLLARPNAKEEMGDASSLKRSSLPFIERELSLSQGRRAKVTFQTTWEDNIALAGHSNLQ